MHIVYSLYYICIFLIVNSLKEARIHARICGYMLILTICIFSPFFVSSQTVSARADNRNNFSLSVDSVRNYDTWAIKGNALFYAAGVTNFGFEHAFDPHWSFDFPVVYSPYTIARTYRMRFMYAQPEARYWLDRPMKGHFFGAHIHVGVFNVSLNERNRYQTPNGFYGAGLSYGYTLPLAKRWSAEFEIGAGYAFTQYDTYYNIHNGARYQKRVPYNYWGITKLAVNIEYRFGEKSGRRKGVAQ